MKQTAWSEERGEIPITFGDMVRLLGPAVEYKVEEVAGSTIHTWACKTPPPVFDGYETISTEEELKDYLIRYYLLDIDEGNRTAHYPPIERLMRERDNRANPTID
jgi:hypothetical protein